MALINPHRYAQSPLFSVEKETNRWIIARHVVASQTLFEVLYHICQRFMPSDGTDTMVHSHQPTVVPTGLVLECLTVDNEITLAGRTTRAKQNANYVRFPSISQAVAGAVWGFH